MELPPDIDSLEDVCSIAPLVLPDATESEAEVKGKRKTRGQMKGVVARAEKGTHKKGSAHQQRDTHVKRKAPPSSSEMPVKKRPSSSIPRITTLPSTPDMPMTFRSMMLEVPQSDVFSTPDSFMEVFSPPRVMFEVVALGMKASRAMDLKTGWDLSKESVQKTALLDIRQRSPQVIGMSPPCTMFSKIQDPSINVI